MTLITHRILISLALLLAGCLGIAGCTLNYDFTECDKDSDCAAYERPQEGRFLTCNDDNRCQRLPDVECESSRHCEADEICRDGTCRTQCNDNAECRERLGSNATCSTDNRCISVTRPLCPIESILVSGAGEPIYVGSIFPDTSDDRLAPYELGVEQAARELRSAAPSLLSNRPVVWLRCRSGADTGSPTDAIRHLDAVGAAAVIGPARDTAFLEVVQNVADANDLPVISPDASAPFVREAAAFGQTAFRTRPSARPVAQTLARWGLERSERDDVQRALLLHADTRAAQQRADAISSYFDSVGSEVEYNTATFPPASQLSPDRSVRLDDYARRADELIPDAADQRPGVVFIIGEGEGGSEIALSYRATIGSTFGDNQDPATYLFTGAAPEESSQFVDAATRWSITPTDTAATFPRIDDRALFRQFIDRLRDRLDDPTSITTHTLRRAAYAFDATAVAIAGIYAADDGPPAELRRVVRTTITDGDLQDTSGIAIPIDGPSAWASIGNERRNDNPIDLQGAASDLRLADDGSPSTATLGLEPGIARNDRAAMIATRISAISAGDNAAPLSPLPPDDRYGQQLAIGSSTTISPGQTSIAWQPELEDCTTNYLLKANIALNHPAPDQLTVTLTHPSGTRRPIFKGRTDPGEFSARIPDAYLPTYNWFDMYGLPGNGQWSLRISDGRSSGPDARLRNLQLTWYCTPTSQPTSP